MTQEAKAFASIIALLIVILAWVIFLSPAFGDWA